MRKVSFCNGEIYHIYNRGVEKRNIFTDKTDLKRFIDSVNLFNSVELTGSFYEQSLLVKQGKEYFGVKIRTITKDSIFVAYKTQSHWLSRLKK